MKRKYLVILALLCATPAQAQMKHFDVGKIDAPAPPPVEKKADDGDAPQDYGGGSFIVTPVQDCYKQLKPGEAADIRKNSASPYEECQSRLKARADEKAKKDKQDKDKDKVKDKPKETSPPVNK